MPRRKQHRRNGENARHPLLTQRFQPIAQDRAGEFQITVFHRQRRELGPKGFNHLGEFLHGQSVATAMAADQNAELFSWKVGQGGRATVRMN